MEYAVELVDIVKQYPGTLANDNVSIRIQESSVFCLVGENGAGKSTLMNVLYGMVKPDSGTIKINGNIVEFNSSLDALKSNIGMVHQHFMLVDELSVLENIIIGSEPGKKGFIDYKKARIEIEVLMQTNGISVNLDSLIGDLPVGTQQKVEILKILYRGADVLILDEPTAVLTPQETDELFNNFTRLSQNGKTIIFITHKLDEVIRMADDIVVMRRGRVVANLKRGETDKIQLAQHMVGKELPNIHDREKKEGEIVLELDKIDMKKENGLFALKNVNLKIKSGEIVGVAGISGNGQDELCRVISGQNKPNNGSVYYFEEDITALSRRERLLKGISYTPADRNKEGLCMEWSIANNSVAGYHILPKFIKKVFNMDFINKKQIDLESKKMIEQFDIRTSGHEAIVSGLSGGNQQKVIIARETVVNSPKLLIAAEPTRGVDVGAISFIHNYIIDLRNNDMAGLIISSDLDEVFALSDRIIVMFEGEILCNVKAGDITKEELGLYMAGSKRQEVQI